MPGDGFRSITSLNTSESESLPETVPGPAQENEL